MEMMWLADCRWEVSATLVTPCVPSLPCALHHHPRLHPHPHPPLASTLPLTLPKSTFSTTLPKPSTISTISSSKKVSTSPSTPSFALSPSKKPPLPPKTKRHTRSPPLQALV